MKKRLTTVFICKLIFLYFFLVELNANEGVVIISDSISYSDSGDSLSAIGNVVVEYGDYKLSTPKLTYNKRTQLLTAGNPIELNDKGSFKMVAESAEINDDFKQIIALHASALIEKKFSLKSQKMQRFQT